MKKILLALALLASMHLAGAQTQVKTVASATKAVEAAQKAADNPKKATNPATWLKLGQAWMDAYVAPKGNGWIGASEQELGLVMGEVKLLGTRNETLQGQPYLVKIYETAEYFFGANGALTAIKVTEPIDPNCLSNALEAYKKAYEVDAKAKKTKDILAGIQLVSAKFVDEAYNSYTIGNMEDASTLFEKAATAAAVAPNSKIDTNAIYNAALTSWFIAGAKDSLESKVWLERSRNFYEQALSYGYYGEDGEVYAKLADIADKLSNKELSRDYLEKGFSAFPHSQSILVGLINYYVASGDNPSRIFELLDLAKQNEPNNASLYYVEGNIHDKLHEEEAAIAAYDKCAEINPEYEFGYIGKGILLYNKAVDLQDKASQEMDDAKYMELVKGFETSLKACIEPFEKAFEISKDESIKVSIAEYLKNACFRFRTDEEYKAKFDKYNQVVADSK